MEEKNTAAVNACTVLDTIGVKAVVRGWFKEAALAHDDFRFLQLETKLQLNSRPVTVGSFSEGSFRVSYKSDRDILIFLSNIEILEADNKTSEQICAVMEYIDQKPGFVHLRFGDKVDLEDQSRLAQSKNGMIQHNDWEEGLPNLMKNGPATRSRRIFCELDLIYCYKCLWPRVAQEWLDRHRPFGWPSPETIAHLQTLDCCVVEKGHPSSTNEEKQLEWRLSFSLQENYLMCNLNDVQFKCFMLLKMIKEDIISPLFGKCLTTYHCKTVLFYTIEGKPQVFWRSTNLIRLLQLCLIQLKQWLVSGFCPNYFIPTADLFVGKLSIHMMNPLGEVLQKIINDPIATLTLLSSSNFGKIFHIYQSAPGERDDIITPELFDLETEATRELTKTVHSIFIMLNLDVENVLSYCLADIETVHQKTENIVYAYQSLIAKQITLSGELKTELGMSALKCQILPVLYAGLASHLMALAIDTKDLMIQDWLVCAAVLNFMHALDGGEVLVTNLKLANVLYVTGHIDSAKKVLDKLEEFIDDRRTTLLSESEAEDVPLHEMLLDSLHKIANIYVDLLFTTEMYILFERFIFRLVTFLKSEIQVTPKALIFEAFRSMGTKQDSRLSVDFSFDRSYMDAVSFYVILRYLVEAKKDITLLYHQIDMIQFGFQVPYMNALGWIAKEEGDNFMAAFSFTCSWQRWLEDIGHLHSHHEIESPANIHHHNAAKLHMLLLMYEMWQNRQSKEH